MAEVEEHSMRTPTVGKAKLSPRSLTETILGLCASGRFGVREAIAAASRKTAQQKREQNRSHTKHKVT